MPRTYGHKFLLGLQNADGNRLGTQLGRMSVEANLPAAYIAKALEVSKTTVYGWFRGRGVREDKRIAVTTLMNMIENDIKQGVLPVNSSREGKLYIQGLIGTEI